MDNKSIGVTHMWVCIQMDTHMDCNNSKEKEDALIINLCESWSQKVHNHYLWGD